MFKKQEQVIRNKASLGTLEYNDIHDIVEYLIKAKSAKIKTIGIYDSDDIAQEVRVKCFKIINKFSSSKGSAVNFFGVCIDNSLTDLKEDTRCDEVMSVSIVYLTSKVFVNIMRILIIVKNIVVF